MPVIDANSLILTVEQAAASIMVTLDDLHHPKASTTLRLRADMNALRASLAAQADNVDEPSPQVSCGPWFNTMPTEPGFYLFYGYTSKPCYKETKPRYEFASAGYSANKVLLMSTGGSFAWDMEGWLGWYAKWECQAPPLECQHWYTKKTVEYDHAATAGERCITTTACDDCPFTSTVKT